MTYTASENRYGQMQYRRCGASGIRLPMLSLGLWHNFGAITPFETQQSILRTAFDHGITHFDLANNYGPPYGEAERNFGVHMDRDWRPYRDELILSTKAGYDMWPGPYGNFGSRKYLIASLDQSLKRMHVDYVDIFYHHRPDPDTPLEETMAALDHIVRSGRALYVGISNYKPEQAKKAIAILKQLGTPCLIHQPSYSMLNRWIEEGLTQVLREEKVGCICFSPLSGGLLTDRYLNGIPADSRAGHHGRKADRHPRPERPGAEARAEAVPNGAAMGAAGRSGHLRPDRGQPSPAGAGQHRGGEWPRVHPGGIGPNRRYPGGVNPLLIYPCNLRQNRV